MPTYSYHCDNCEHEFDKQQGFNDPNLTSCPECEKEALHRIYRPAQVVFKGSGYYVNDSRGKKSTLKKPKGEGGGDGGESKNGKSEKKSESKSESKSTTKKESSSKSKSSSASS